MKIESNFIITMQDYLLKVGKLIPPTKASLDRKVGETLPFSCHVKYMIYALLSNQEKWSNVEKNLSKIDDVFFQYDVQKIKNRPWEYFYENIKPLVIRGLSLRGQMQNLHKNIGTLESIHNNYKNGGLDGFVTSRPPREIVIKFTKDYKLKFMAFSLVCEYLKNVGVLCAKPDTHVMRFLSKTRRGFLPKHESFKSKDKQGKEIVKETAWRDTDKLLALEVIEKISETSGMSPSDVDGIIWSYCADDFGEICTKTPKCWKCVVEDGCNYSAYSKK